MSGTGDNGDRAILAAIERDMQLEVHEIFRRYWRWHSRPGTPPERWDDAAGKFVDIFLRDSLECLHGMTQFAKKKLAGLN